MGRRESQRVREERKAKVKRNRIWGKSVFISIMRRENIVLVW